MLTHFLLRSLFNYVLHSLIGFVFWPFFTLVLRYLCIPMLQKFGHPRLENPQCPVHQLIKDTSKLQSMQDVLNIAAPYTSDALKKRLLAGYIENRG